MRLFGLIFDNFGLKVLALVMAWAVWFMTRESLTEQRDIPMEVDVVVQGDDQVEARATPLRVNVTVTGTARGVAEFEKLANPRVVVQVQPKHFPTDEQWMRTETFVLDEIQLPDISNPTELRAKSMDPDVIEVRIERIAIREFPVEAPLKPELLGGAQVEVMQPTPSATVRGTIANLDALKGSIKTVINQDVINALAMGLDDQPTVEDRIDLEIAPSQQGVFKFLELVEPERLSAKVAVSNIDSADFRVPVFIFTSGSGGRRLQFSPTNEIDLTALEWAWGEDGEPPTILLSLIGSPRSIARVDPAKLVVFVRGDDMQDDETVSRLPLLVSGLPVGVRQKEDITLHVQDEQ